MPAVRLSGAPSARDAPGLTPPLPTRSPTQCSVCLMDVENDATSMPCGHLHHKECLTRWLRTHNTCPLCRSTIEADETARPNNALQTLLQGWREARREHTAAAGISGVSASTSTVDAGANPSVVNSSTNGSNGSGRANMGSISFGEAPFFFHGQAPALMPALPPPSEAELLGFSVAELKARLRLLGVDTSSVTGRRELQDLLRRHAHDPPPPPMPTRVQVHMEVLQMPGSGGLADLRAAMQAASQAAAAHAEHQDRLEALLQRVGTDSNPHGPGGAALPAPPTVVPFAAPGARPSVRLLSRMARLHPRAPHTGGTTAASATDPLTAPDSSSSAAADEPTATPAPMVTSRSPPDGGVTVSTASATNLEAVTAPSPSASRRRPREPEQTATNEPEQRQTRQRTRSQQ
jgi:hypothetical protein